MEIRSEADRGGVAPAEERAPVPRRKRRLSRGDDDYRGVRLIDAEHDARPSSGHLGERYRSFAAMGVIAVITTVGAAICIANLVGGSTVANNTDNCTEAAAALCAAIACLIAAHRRRGRSRWSWRWLAVGSFAWFCGQCDWVYYGLRGITNAPFPGYPDIGFLVAIPLLLIGVLVYPVDPATTLSKVRITLDGVIVAASLLTLSWASVLNTLLMSAHESSSKTTISLMYPLADLAIATVALTSLARSGQSRRVPLLLIVVGIFGLGLSDSAFFYYTTTGNYPVSSVSDIGWTAGYFLIALAALWPQHATTRTPGRRATSIWQVVIPYLALFSAIVTDVVLYSIHHSISGFLIVDGLVLVGVVFVRQVIIVLENYRLNSNLQAAVETLRAEETELSRLALHDPLTGLANRLLFTERLDAALTLAAAGQRRVAVVFCDLDGFKDANDSLGHAAGDAMLVGVAQRLLACVRPEDTVARLGGDEFAIVLEDLDDLSDASRVAARIVDTIRDPLVVGAERFLLHVSIGIALASEGSYGIEELLRDADIALYAAKNAGGNRYRMFDSTMGTAYLDRLRLEADLVTALENNELFVEYQPIVDLSNDAPIGVEALLRWRHPTRGLLQPASFLATAERSGSIVAIGKWVLEESLTQLRAWQSEMALPPGFSIAVNLSVRQLEAGDLVSSLENAIASSGVDPRLVRLELTETSLIDRAEASIDLLHALRRLGVHLEIDDFGTGYSSLDYLRRLPLDILKIDQSFITGLGTDPHDTLIVETIINLAHALGMTVVAEGVETPLQLARLRNLNCDFGQGFYWSRSLGPAALAAWINEPRQLGASAPIS